MRFEPKGVGARRPSADAGALPAEASHESVRRFERSDSFYLWTHCFDDSAMPRGDLRRVPFSERVETKECRGVTVRLHERSYYQAWRDPSFCGGIHDRHYWIGRDDIPQLVARRGFERLRIADKQPDHVNGPSFSVFAERSNGIMGVDGAVATSGAAS